MVPAGPHLIRVAMQPCGEGLSTIDFCFTGVSSSDSTRQKECDGINGKMCWTLVTNHFMGMKHGDTCISRGPLLKGLLHCLSQCNPSCTDKRMHPDQGGELFNHPEVRNLFAKKGHSIHPTGSDNS